MKYVVIGASAAGLSAAKMLRQQDPAGQISVISFDTDIHSRCMLHHYLGKVKTKEQLRFVPADFFEKNKINFLQGERVKAVVPEKNHLLLMDGTEIGYDKLLIASGAYYFVPPIPNLREGKNVYGFRDLPDAERLSKAADTSKSCVIIGSGLVGLDAAYALCERGVKCAVVEMADRISPLQLDHTAAAIYQEKFEEAGCTFYLSDGVVGSTLGPDGNVVSVELKSGGSLPCDFVVVSAGVRPNVAFLEGSGIAVDRGVTVDDFMRTNIDNIWAAGDVTGISGIWIAATKQGELAARNMCGEQVPYEDRFAFKNTMHFFELNTLSLGKDDGDREDEEVIVRESKKQYEKFKIRDGVLTYALIQGDISNRGFLEQLVKRKIPLTDVKKPVWQLSYADFYQYEPATGKFNW